MVGSPSAFGRGAKAAERDRVSPAAQNLCGGAALQDQGGFFAAAGGFCENQTYENWELCLSDGSGKDSPIRELLKKLAEEEPRIRVVFHEEQLPHCAQYQCGHCRGDRGVYRVCGFMTIC